jgi:hypothetical protein
MTERPGYQYLADALDRASHVSEKAIANALAGLRVRLAALDRIDELDGDSDV